MTWWSWEAASQRHVHSTTASSTIYLHDLASRRTLVNQVFLGGACDPTTWRQDIAIPILELLFVFDPQTRAIANLNEAVEFMLAGQQKVVLVASYVEPGQVIAGQKLTPEEAMDINIARSELFEIAKAHMVSGCSTTGRSRSHSCGDPSMGRHRIRSLPRAWIRRSAPSSDP